MKLTRQACPLVLVVVVMTAVAGCASRGGDVPSRGDGDGIDLRTPESAARAWGDAWARGDADAVRAIAYTPDAAYRDYARALGEFLSAWRELKETAQKHYGAGQARLLLQAQGTDPAEYGRLLADGARKESFRVRGDSAVAKLGRPDPDAMRLKRTRGRWKVVITPRPTEPEPGDDSVYAQTPEMMALGLDVVAERLHATADEIAAGKYPSVSDALVVFKQRAEGHDPGDDDEDMGGQEGE